MFRKAILAASLFIPAIAHADWYEASSKHFVVYSDDAPDKITAFTERLERFDQSLRMITGTPDSPLSPNLRVAVYTTSDVTALQKFAGSNSIAGFYIPRASGPTAFVPRKTSGPLDAQAILQHEYGHSFMFSSWPSAVFAKWFVEGFAEFVGTAFFRTDGSLVFGKPPEYRGYGMLEKSQVPANQLLMLNPGKMGDLQTHILYGRGWLLTHYSILGGHAVELGNYIKLSNEGKTAEASRAFGDPAALDSKLNAYAQRKSVAVITLTKDQVPIGKVEIRKLSAGESATIQARMASNRGVDEKQAPGVAEAARRLAAPYPNDAAAQDTLAEAEFDAKNYAAAEAAADRAIAANPKSIHALMYKGMAQQEIAKAAKDKDPARWKSIRAWFLKANKLDTEYPQPLILFYDSFEAQGIPATANAQTGLLGAYVLAPYDPGLRFKAGKVLLEQDNAKAARVAFEPLAYSPHASPDNLSLKAVTALDTKSTKEVLKIITDAEAEAKKKEEEAKAKKKAG